MAHVCEISAHVCKNISHYKAQAMQAPMYSGCDWHQGTHQGGLVLYLDSLHSGSVRVLWLRQGKN